MAKSLEIPAVVGVGEATHKIKSGDILIVDGTMGTIIVNPDEETLRIYQEEERKLRGVTERFLRVKDLPAVTLDGKAVAITANIELPDEIQSVQVHGASGIGLYRTEFFYMNRNDTPRRKKIPASKWSGTDKTVSVVLRTWTAVTSSCRVSNARETKPFLVGAISFCLARPDIFKVSGAVLGPRCTAS
jgi:phosphotransferase system enzyme I (PtsI)